MTKPRYTPKNHPMLPGEMRFKEFAINEAERLGVSTQAIVMRFHRGKYPNLKVRRVNHANVFVRHYTP